MLLGFPIAFPVHCSSSQEAGRQARLKYLSCPPLFSHVLIQREYLQRQRLYQDLNLLHVRSILCTFDNTKPWFFFPFRKVKVKVTYSILTKQNKLENAGDMWSASSHLYSHKRLQILLMFCQGLDSVLCSHAELPIMVIYVLGEFTSPILLRSFISMEGWYIQYWFSWGAALTFLNYRSNGGWGRQTQFKGVQLRNGSELKRLNFLLLFYPWHLLKLVCCCCFCFGKFYLLCFCFCSFLF